MTFVLHFEHASIQVSDSPGQVVHCECEAANLQRKRVDPLRELVYSLAQLIDALAELHNSPRQRQEVISEDRVAHAVAELRVLMQLRDKRLDLLARASDT